MSVDVLEIAGHMSALLPGLSADDREDLRQAICLRLLERQDAIDIAVDPPTYAYGVARRHMGDWQRLRRRAAARERGLLETARQMRNDGKFIET